VIIAPHSLLTISSYMYTKSDNFGLTLSGTHSIGHDRHMPFPTFTNGWARGGHR